jgi:putative polyhydroxyalkanoate system protein
MPSIEISRKHDKTIAEGKKAVERVAQSIAKRFSVTYGWDGNTLHFERPGVSGHIALTKGMVKVAAELSFLLGAIRGPIEREIKQHLETEFG